MRALTARSRVSEKSASTAASPSGTMRGSGPAISARLKVIYSILYINCHESRLGAISSSKTKVTNWCPGPESNRHDRLGSGDFKSPVSTSFTTRARFNRHASATIPVGGEVWRRGAESNRSKRLCRPLHNRFATAPRLRLKREGPQRPSLGESGAGEESRTLDLNLGKVALYQLSYSRIEQPAILKGRAPPVKPSRRSKSPPCAGNTASKSPSGPRPR